jgi:hypothetical protein
MHYPIDHCPAELAVVAVPEIPLPINSDRTMPALMLRDRASVSSPILTRWPKIISTLA